MKQTEGMHKRVCEGIALEYPSGSAQELGECLEKLQRFNDEDAFSKAQGES